MPSASLQTRFGPLTVTEEAGAITTLKWGPPWGNGDNSSPTPLLVEALEQLAAYDECGQFVFDLPLSIGAPPLVQAVCAEMRVIPTGETRTYGEIARVVGSSPQAVGQACGQNPIPIIVPCHRVLGAGGKLTGFSGAGGVETKVALLRHEGAAGLLI
jgi:methylated-DNA-[protein]-cysteine S-methyltransferase